MKTLLVIVPGSEVDHDCVFHILHAESGEHLASHFCSHSGHAYGDLYSTRKERIEEWTKRWGELEVKFINETDISTEELRRRNKIWFDSLPPETPAVERPTITAELSDGTKIIQEL